MYTIARSVNLLIGVNWRHWAHPTSLSVCTVTYARVRRIARRTTRELSCWLCIWCLAWVVACSRRRCRKSQLLGGVSL